MIRFTVILSEIAADNIDAACCMPARKLAGAAIAAASNKRLMVMPPDVTATVEFGTLCTDVDDVPWFENDGVGDIIPKNALATRFPPSFPADGTKLAEISSSKVLKMLSSGRACR